MDQTEEPVQSNTNENDENFDSEEQEEQYCGSKSAHVIDDCRESELSDCDSKQVRFEENGESADQDEEKDSEEQRLRTDKNVCETNGVDDLTHDDDDDENDDDDDQKETPSASAGDDEIFEQQEEENIAAESDEEKLEDEQNLPTDENKTEEDATPEEDDIEKDIQNVIQKESQYDRTSSFSSLSVNVGSTQQDSDSEVQIPSRASPDSGDDTPMVDEENYSGKREDIKANGDESDHETETQEEREARLVKQAHLDIASSVDSPEDLDANDNKSASNEDLNKQESDSEDTLTASESGLESTKEKDDVEEESFEKAQSHDEGIGNNDENDEDIDENVHQEKSEESQSAAAEKDVSEVLVSENKDGGQDETVDESEKAEPEEPAPACKDDEKEQTKVKELGLLFQGKDQNPKAVCPKGTTSSEKSPISVRRFREMFEHGEPLLSPAAYANVPEEECSSPRPGIVKNLRDLFENPKNFEWKEAPKSTAVVN